MEQNLSTPPLSIHQIARDFRARHRQPNGKYERNDDIRQLRNEEGWSLQAIAGHYGITRERVRQIVGNSGDLYFEKIKEKVLDPVYKFIPASQVAELTGVPFNTVVRLRKGKWHIVEPGSSLADGQGWEIWASSRLWKIGVENALMPAGHPFDILTKGGQRIDVKSSNPRPTRQREFVYGVYDWHFRNGPGKEFDYFILVCADTEVSYIIPRGEAAKTIVRISKNPKRRTKYDQYREAWHLLKETK